MARLGSPSGGSTLMTSAPKSARSLVQKGPEMVWDRSTILMSERAYSWPPTFVVVTGPPPRSWLWAAAQHTYPLCAGRAPAPRASGNDFEVGSYSCFCGQLGGQSHGAAL